MTVGVPSWAAVNVVDPAAVERDPVVEVDQKVVENIQAVTEALAGPEKHSVTE